MRSGLAGVALVCVMSIFLFPGVTGPFPATHGPATALRAKRASFILTVCIVIAGIFTVAARLVGHCRAKLATLCDPLAAQSSGPPALSCVLLC
jgi:hypothetical protein